MNYFKKLSPKIKVLLSMGQWLEFQNVDDEVGIYPPEGRGISPQLTEELRNCIRAGRGGMTEINAAEYAELVQKKNSGPRRKLWREEISKPAMLETVSKSIVPKVEPPVAVPSATVVVQGESGPRESGLRESVPRETPAKKIERPKATRKSK